MRDDDLESRTKQLITALQLVADSISCATELLKSKDFNAFKDKMTTISDASEKLTRQFKDSAPRMH